MRKKIALLCLFALLLICACGRQSVSLSQAEPQNSGAASAAASLEPLPESSAALATASPPAGFQVPEEPYWVLGVVGWGEDQNILLYEEAFPDEYNKQFSQDTVFHAIRWQILDKDDNFISKGNSGWSNGFPIHEYITSIRRPANDGTLVFDAEMPAEYSGAPFRRRFTLVVDDSRQDLLEKDLNGWRIFTEDWYPLAKQDGWKLETLNRYNAELGRDETVLLMSDGIAEKTVVIGEYDQDLWHELYQLTHPGEVVFEGQQPTASTMTVSFDPAKETAVLSIPKMTVRIDFKTGSVKTERHYSNDQLQTKVVESPDAAHSVYTTGEFDRFEGPSGSDYVVTGADGAIHYLYAGNGFDTVLFAGNDKIIVNSINALTFYDPATGKPCEQQPAFDLGEADYQGKPQQKYLVVGLAVDQKNERILAAYRLNTFGNWDLTVDGTTLNTFPVSLAVMDFSGKVISQLETGLSVRAFGKFTLIPVEIKTDEAGNATVSCDYAPDAPASVTVSYLS